jgi:hypothetical protein
MLEEFKEWKEVSKENANNLISEEEKSQWYRELSGFKDHSRLVSQENH